MLVDTHCHLDEPPVRDDVAGVLSRARTAGVTCVVGVGVRPGQWERLAALRDAHEGVGITVGLHPELLPELSEGEIAGACASLGERARTLGALAIGECGFDGPTRARGVSLERQAEIARAHCEAADALGLPLVVHVHGAMGFALAFFESLGPRPHGGVLHAFGGPAELVPRWAALGFSFGIGPSITWSRARRPKDAARAVPLDRILLETDGPGTYVEGATARVGEPAQVRDVLRALAALRAMDEARLEEITSRNAVRLFGDRLGPRP